MSKADAVEDVTCAVCLKVLAGPGEKKSKAKADRLTITCGCGTQRDIYAYQYGIVTRCDTCQKRYRRHKTAAKRKERTKARKAEKRLILQQGILSHQGDAFLILKAHRDDKAMLHAVIREARAMLGYKK